MKASNNCSKFSNLDNLKTSQSGGIMIPAGLFIGLGAAVAFTFGSDFVQQKTRISGGIREACNHAVEIYARAWTGRSSTTDASAALDAATKAVGGKLYESLGQSFKSSSSATRSTLPPGVTMSVTTPSLAEWKKRVDGITVQGVVQVAPTGVSSQTASKNAYYTTAGVSAGTSDLLNKSVNKTFDKNYFVHIADDATKTRSRAVDSPSFDSTLVVSNEDESVNVVVNLFDLQITSGNAALNKIIGPIGKSSGITDYSVQCAAMSYVIEGSKYTKQKMEVIHMYDRTFNPGPGDVYNSDGTIKIALAESGAANAKYRYGNSHNSGWDAYWPGFWADHHSWMNASDPRGIGESGRYDGGVCLQGPNKHTVGIFRWAADGTSYTAVDETLKGNWLYLKPQPSTWTENYCYEFDHSQLSSVTPDTIGSAISIDRPGTWASFTFYKGVPNRPKNDEWIPFDVVDGVIDNLDELHAFGLSFEPGLPGYIQCDHTMVGGKSIGDPIYKVTEASVEQYMRANGYVAWGVTNKFLHAVSKASAQVQKEWPKLVAYYLANKNRLGKKVHGNPHVPYARVGDPKIKKLRADLDSGAVSITDVLITDRNVGTLPDYKYVRSGGGGGGHGLNRTEANSAIMNHRIGPRPMYAFHSPPGGGVSLATYGWDHRDYSDFFPSYFQSKLTKQINSEPGTASKYAYAKNLYSDIFQRLSMTYYQTANDILGPKIAAEGLGNAGCCSVITHGAPTKSLPDVKGDVRGYVGGVDAPVVTGKPFGAREGAASPNVTSALAEYSDGKSYSFNVPLSGKEARSVWIQNCYTGAPWWRMGRNTCSVRFATDPYAAHSWKIVDFEKVGYIAPRDVDDPIPTYGCPGVQNSVVTPYAVGVELLTDSWKTKTSDS